MGCLCLGWRSDCRGTVLQKNCAVGIESILALEMMDSATVRCENAQNLEYVLKRCAISQEASRYLASASSEAPRSEEGATFFDLPFVLP